MKRNLEARLVLLVSVTLLIIFGVTILYSTVYQEAAWYRYRSHLHWLYVGLVAGLVMAWADYHWLDRPPLMWIIGVLSLGLLLALFVPGLGIRANGATRWLPGLGQPSEFAKPAVIVILAGWCSRLKPEENIHPLTGFLAPGLMGAVPAGLVFLQPDWGTAVLLGGITLSVLAIAGVQWRYLVGTIVFVAIMLAIMVADDPTRLARVIAFTDPEAHRFGAGWQVWNGLLAIGSGGLWGCFLEGSLHKFGFVPEQQTDYIFARVGEETGFWGAGVVVLCFFGILWAGLQITTQARDSFGRLLAWGCTMAITLQSLINVAVVTSLVPNKGLPLPFMSFGGSNLLVMCVCVGLLVNVAGHSEQGSAEAQPNRNP